MGHEIHIDVKNEANKPLELAQGAGYNRSLAVLTSLPVYLTCMYRGNVCYEQNDCLCSHFIFNLSCNLIPVHHYFAKTVYMNICMDECMYVY